MTATMDSLNETLNISSPQRTGWIPRAMLAVVVQIAAIALIAFAG